MQQTGIETIQNVASSLGGLGRYGDTYIVHAAEGETVIPLEVLDRDPLLKERLFDSMRAMGIEPERYIVGNELNSLNPVTGQPEFFLKQLKKIMKSPWAQAAASFFIPGGYSWLAAPAMEAIAGGDTKDIFHAALRGGAGQLSGDYLGGEGLWGDTGKFANKGSPDWWTKLKEGVWKPSEKLTFDKKWDIIQEGKILGQQKGLTGKELSAFVTDYSEKAIAAASKSGFMQTMGSKIMEDPLQALFTGGMAWGQYDEAKRFNEALQRQSEQDTDYQYNVSNEIIGDVLDTQTDSAYETPLIYSGGVTPVAKGGIMRAFPRKDGGISGPGTGTSDDIPAMLSDGEFVMTANAVKGAGNGSRSAGTKKMYDMMRQFEGSA